MGLFNKGSQKTHCPNCGAKNEADTQRCRICTCFMDAGDGSLRRSSNGPQDARDEEIEVDERRIDIPATTSTVPTSSVATSSVATSTVPTSTVPTSSGFGGGDHPETTSAASFTAIDDSDGFDMEALQVDFQQQTIPPAGTMAEALPAFDNDEPVELSPKPDPEGRSKPGRLELSQLRSSSQAVNSPNATYERIGFHSDADAELALPADTDFEADTRAAEPTSPFNPF